MKSHAFCPGNKQKLKQGPKLYVYILHQKNNPVSQFLPFNLCNEITSNLLIELSDKKLNAAAFYLHNVLIY